MIIEMLNYTLDIDMYNISINIQSSDLDKS